jgi:mannose-6-phosphate isomerase-like protein (cupin superfamily)
MSIVNRPWGNYKIILESQDYKIKIIEVNPEQRISLQKHMYRKEYWTILDGNGIVQYDDTHITVQRGSRISIEQNELHRVTNCGSGILKILEIQFGSKLSEDDIIRVEDNYGRV